MIVMSFRVAVSCTASFYAESLGCCRVPGHQRVIPSEWRQRSFGDIVNVSGSGRRRAAPSGGRLWAGDLACAGAQGSLGWACGRGYLM